MPHIIEPIESKTSCSEFGTTGGTRSAPRRTLVGWLVGFVCDHHNKIQFFGYEVANILLVWHVTGNAETLFGSFNSEAMAAMAFLFGSACIYAYHPDRRPAGLFFGGIGLTLGGALLVFAGYPLTGLSVALASMETARGGLRVLKTDLSRSDRSTPSVASLILVFGQHALSFYIVPVDMFCRRFGKLGQFLNDRPFLTGSLIKLPLRLEFIIKNLLRGDMIGACIGLSWMVLGDGALAFNDEKLRRSALLLGVVPTSCQRQSTIPTRT